MNERIDQLIEQCTAQQFSDCVGGYETFDKEKFARLIQRDTIQCLRDMFEENSTNWLVLNAIIETGFKE